MPRPCFDRPLPCLLMTLAAFALGAHGASAQGSGTPMLQALGPERVLSLPTDKDPVSPQVAWNSTDAEFYVVWGQFDLYGSAVHVDGVARTAPAILHAGNATAPPNGLAYAPSNNSYLVTWKSQDAAHHPLDAVGIVFDADGLPQSPATGLVVANDEGSLVYNPNDDEYFYQGRTPSILGQRVSTAGAPLIPGGIQIETAGAPAPAGEIAHSSVTNRYLANWRDQVEEVHKARILAADGSSLVGPFDALPFFTGSDRSSVDTTYDASRDRFLIAGTEFDRSALRAFAIDSSGNHVGSMITIGTGTGFRQCSVEYDALHDVYVIAWIENQDRLWVRLLGPDGALIGDEIKIAERFATMPDLGVDGASRVLLAWVDERDQDALDLVVLRTLAFAITEDGLSSFCDCAASAPCGNTAAGRGCANSTGAGASLASSGSTSVALDDLVLTLTDLPPNLFGLQFMGDGTSYLPFGDGHRCVATAERGVFRYDPQNSGAGGQSQLGPGIVAISQTFGQPEAAIESGSTWYFQGWYRDPNGPCTSGFNLSNGIAVTFAP